jgi:predicted NUDIX family NTP pyrophosphohydrolase
MATSRVSAGLLLYRRREGVLEVLLGHMGGPFHARRDAGAWTIPKGGPEPGEPLLHAALREFREETGQRPTGEPQPLAPIQQRGGKQVHAFALEGDMDPAGLRSNSFQLEWPPRSGMIRQFPELDRVKWFPIAEACALAIPGQDALFLELQARMAIS